MYRHLVRHAHSTIDLPDLGSESYQEREGGQALRYSKSDENATQIKALLNDPGWAYLHHAQENNGVEVRIYGVRDAAYKSLKSWGVDVDVRRESL